MVAGRNAGVDKTLPKSWWQTDENWHAPEGTMVGMSVSTCEMPR